jgi:hypothetical protein
MYRDYQQSPLIAKPYSNPPARSAKPINALINTQNHIPNPTIPSLLLVLTRLHLITIHNPFSFSGTKFGPPVIWDQYSKLEPDKEVKTVL